MSDEGFQEIHLGNKQLVFLAMAGVVVLVVAFLFGVLVGRGARSQETAEAAVEAGTPAEATPAGAPAEAPTAAAPASSAPLSAPEPANEDLDYLKRLEGSQPAADSLRATSKAAPADKAGAPPPPAGKTTPPAAAAGAATPAAAVPAAASEPPGQGYQVQVVALRDRAKAAAVAQRLAAKGHHAYLAPPDGRSGSMYRVLVGKFKTRQEAEQVKRRIEKEEQFKPWIIR